MHWIDLRTIFFATSLMAALVSCILLIAHYSFPANVRGLRTTARANFTLVLVSVAFGLRDIIPDAISIVVADILLFLGYWLMLAGLREFLRLPPTPYRKVIGSMLVFAVAIGYWSQVEPSFRMRSIVVSGLTLVCQASLAFTLFRHQRNGMERCFGYLKVLGVCFSLLQLARSVLGDDQSTALAGGIHSTVGNTYLIGFAAMSLVHGLLFFLIASRQLHQELLDMASRDPLTGALNRRGMLERVPELIPTLVRKRQPLAVVVFDLDHFKNINDTYGHAQGDQVLCHFAALVSAEKRASDWFVRLGGEEFALVLPETDAAQARALAERIQQGLRQPSESGLPHYTSSIGIHATASPQTGCDPVAFMNTLLHGADRAVYRAKQQGRDCIAMYDAQDSTPAHR